MANGRLISRYERSARRRALALFGAITICAACAHQDAELAAAENLIDAFYSWEAPALATALQGAPADAPRALYYQAWAEAGNYRIQTRRPCARDPEGRIECAITVTDDIGKTLGYVATDTFQLTVQSGRVVRVQFTSDDPPVFDALFQWMGEDRPDVFAGPCKDLFAGGTTPADCVRAVVRGARDFVDRPAP